MGYKRIAETLNVFAQYRPLAHELAVHSPLSVMSVSR
jgi:hypothetical protein